MGKSETTKLYVGVEEVTETPVKKESIPWNEMKSNKSFWFLWIAVFAELII